MGVIVDYSYYTGEYMGTEVDETSFPTLNAHASRIIGAVTRFQVDESTIDKLPPIVQTLYKLAVCSQIDFLSINGIESVNGGDDSGFTVGKVRLDGKSGSSSGGVMSMSISPAAITYLEQTGLMNPQVSTVDGWWV